MKVLVTGAAGFIGSNLSKRCVEEGWDVTGIDDLSNGHIQFVPKGVELLQSDFSSDNVKSRLEKQSYDVVLHLAACPRVSYSVEHPFETNDINVTKTLKLMNYCRGNVSRFVFASSSAIYGNVEELPTKETCHKNPQSPYALQKLIIEGYLKLYNDLYGMDSACLRFFNVFGSNQLGDSPYATAVSAWLNAVNRGQSMRSDGDGSQTRDMCHVDNVVEACILAAKTPVKLNAEPFNVACGERTSNKDILKYLLSRYPEAKYHDSPWRPGDVMHTQADITKIHDVLGYKPLVSFWDGLESTIEWYEENWELVSGMKLRT